MISLDTALRTLNDHIQTLGAERVPLSAAAGRILAEPVTALRTQPPFAASAMDGYAVRASDLGGGVTCLTTVGESAAGHASSRPLGAGEAMRISTGAPIPSGADQVVIQENVSLQDDRIQLRDRSSPGNNIRPAGTDFRAGDTLLTPGAQLTPAALSLLASAGLTELCLVRRPHVAILSTGDELVEPGEATRPDQIINSLAPAVAAMVQNWGGVPRYIGIARDTPEEVRNKIADASEADILVTIGGASVGDHDHLRTVFKEMGGQTYFEKIAVKPGKPTWFGSLGGHWVLGLPGNPVSAMVMALLCLKPALARLSGTRHETVFVTAELGGALPANGPRETFVRARFDPATGLTSPLTNQDSSAASALVAANCLIRRPADAKAAPKGASTEIVLLDHP